MAVFDALQPDEPVMHGAQDSIQPFVVAGKLKVAIEPAKEARGGLTNASVIIPARVANSSRPSSSEQLEHDTENVTINLGTLGLYVVGVTPIEQRLAALAEPYDSQRAEYNNRAWLAIAQQLHALGVEVSTAKLDEAMFIRSQGVQLRGDALRDRSARSTAWDTRLA